MTETQQKAVRVALLVAMYALVALPHLVGAQMPWDAPLGSVSESILGPVLAALLPVAFVLFGLAWMFGMHIAGWIMGLVGGGIIAANAAFFVGWLGGGGG
jgi:type IV secretory pathway VirB2 component (pilin)